MSTSKSIQRKKDLFGLPFYKDQLEFWGPLGASFSNSFLTMGEAFLKQFFGNNNVKGLKPIFSSFVELVQNVSEYNELEYSDNLPQSYVNLKIENQFVIIQTANKLKDKSVGELKARLEAVISSTDEEIKNKHKETLLGGGSLGFIMLKKLKDAKFDYEIKEEGDDNNWLSLELKINYGSITD